MLFALLSLPRLSWAQDGIATNSSVVGRSGGEVSLSAPHGFGTMRRLHSRGSMPNNGQTMDRAEGRPLTLDVIERSGDALAIRQLQPTKLKKVSRRAWIIIAIVAVPVAIIVFDQMLKRAP